MYLDIAINGTAEEASVRLVGGDGIQEGRVEIYLFGQWGTVCNSGWDLVDATVVCHQLGYLRAVGAPRSAAFGAGSGPSWYNNVQCTGNERNLTECSKYEMLGEACTHSRDVGAVCSSESKTLLAFMYVLLKMCTKCKCSVIKLYSP